MTRSTHPRTGRRPHRDRAMNCVFITGTDTGIGKTVVACTNLPPRKMMGEESNGMLLSAEKEGVLNLLMLDDAVPAGSTIC